MNDESTRTSYAPFKSDVCEPGVPVDDPATVVPFGCQTADGQITGRVVLVVVSVVVVIEVVVVVVVTEVVLVAVDVDEVVIIVTVVCDAVV